MNTWERRPKNATAGKHGIYTCIRPEGGNKTTNWLPHDQPTLPQLRTNRKSKTRRDWRGIPNQDHQHAEVIMQICLRTKHSYVNKMQDAGNSVEYDIKYLRQELQHPNTALASNITSQYNDKTTEENWAENKAKMQKHPQETYPPHTKEKWTNQKRMGIWRGGTSNRRGQRSTKTTT